MMDMILSHSPPQKMIDHPNESEDEIRAAEAEFASKKEPSPSNRMMTEPSSGEQVTRNHADSTDQQPRKKLKLTEADKKRSVRMFGALMGTLSKFHDETSKTKQTEAAKRRAAVESRLQAKLKLEAEALHQLRALEVEETSLKTQVLRKADELGHLSEIHAIQFSNKLAFSHYLRTSTFNLKTADHDEPPLTTYGRPRHSEQSVFWLPYKLLPEQKEVIENQRRTVREEVEEQQRLWEEERLDKQAELEKLQAHRDARLAEIQTEKARARVNAGSDPSIDAPNLKSSHPTSAHEATDAPRRETSVMRQDTPDIANNDGGDEDAVEY